MTEPISRRERELARHRQDILNVAEHLFAEHGFHETTMQMVAEQAEFSVGYLYKHFSGKEEMHREMVIYHLSRMDELMAEVEKLGLPPLDKLYRNYQDVSGHFNDHRDFMRIFHKEIAGPCDELVEEKQRHYQMLVTNLDEAVATGALNACDTKLLAAAIQGATKDLFGVLAERSSERPFDELTRVIFSLLIDPLRS